MWVGGKTPTGNTMEAIPERLEVFKGAEHTDPADPLWNGTSSNKRKLDSYIEKIEIFTLLRALIVAEKAAIVLKIGSFVHF